MFILYSYLSWITHFVVHQTPIPSFTGLFCLFRGRFVQIETFKSVDQTNYRHFFRGGQGTELEVCANHVSFAFLIMCVWDQMNVKLMKHQSLMNWLFLFAAVAVGEV